MKKIFQKLFWFETDEQDVILISQTNEQANFSLLFGELEIGTLSYVDNVWKFSYSEEFKSQKNILPLVNFPTLDKEYVSSELWPFFISRIPSLAQRQAKECNEKKDLVSLLKNYGRKTIANPYQLIPT